MTEKELLVRLYEDKDGKYYVQIGLSIFIVKEVIVSLLKEREGLEVVYVKNINDVK